MLVSEGRAPTGSRKGPSTARFLSHPIPSHRRTTTNTAPAGRRTHAADPDTDLDWYIDAAGRITKAVDGKLSKTVIYAYDAAGRRTSLDGPEASDTQAWSFDAVGRVTKITENSNDRAEWLYDLAGGRTKLTYGSGNYANRKYDAAGRLTSLAHKKSGGTVIQSFDYVLDKVGNRTKLTLNGGDYVEYLYDPLYQLTKEHRKTSGGSTQYRNDFYYNYISNRTKKVHNDGTSDTTTTYSYSTADQLTKETTGGTDTTYTYDANGALTRKASGGSNYDYLYDTRSLVTKHDAPGTANDTTYTWDLTDSRVKKDVNGTFTRFLYDHSLGDIIAEYDGSETPVLQANYVPIGLDSNISMTRSGSVYYFHPDAIQSTWNLTLATDETVKNTYAYQAFGSQYGTPTENVTNTRRFTGAEWNTEDSTQTHGVRRYFPTVGSWVRRDPALDADAINLFLYVHNNPVKYVDVMGLRAGCPFGSVPAPVPGYQPNPNGCNGPNFPLFGADFTSCCNDHDNCYDNCYKSRSNCDNKFLICMQGACRKRAMTPPLPHFWTPRGCLLIAQSYYGAVRAFGDRFYCQAQDASCHCVYLCNPDLVPIPPAL